ncbi:TPA: hypothetical protein ACH3X3_003489 [Trebouxia sp. C0006]
MEYESKVGAPLMDMPAKEHWQVYEHLANPPPHSKCCALETLQGQLAANVGQVLASRSEATRSAETQSQELVGWVLLEFGIALPVLQRRLMAES